MGTRNLTMVIEGEQVKVAQYGQWDGYPEGQGATALNLLRGFDMNEFRKKVHELRWLTNEEVAEIETVRDWDKKYPYLSRNAGAEILKAIYHGKMEVLIGDGLGGKKEVECKVKGLVNKENFAGDSLFCEWAYVVDLDKMVFEVYRGFNTKKTLNEKDRFFYLQAESIKSKEEDTYYPIKMIKSFDLVNLPTEIEFLESIHELLEKE